MNIWLPWALADDVEDAGAVVVGPAFWLEAAQEMGRAGRGWSAGAVLDVRLQSQLILPVARVWWSGQCHSCSPPASTGG